jgi:hypothetical protein
MRIEVLIMTEGGHQDMSMMEREVLLGTSH